MQKVFKAIYWLLIALISVIAVVIVVSILPIRDNIKILTVLSGSMEPAISTGSVVIVKPSANYRINDVITFGKISKTETPTTHRIYDIRLQAGQPIFITKGDANNAPDIQEVALPDVQGKVLLAVPLAGYGVNFVKTPLGLFLVIIIPVIVIVASEVRKIYVELKKRQEKSS